MRKWRKGEVVITYRLVRQDKEETYRSIKEHTKLKAGPL